MEPKTIVDVAMKAVSPIIALVILIVVLMKPTTTPDMMTLGEVGRTSVRIETAVKTLTEKVDKMDTQAQDDRIRQSKLESRVDEFDRRMNTLNMTLNSLNSQLDSLKVEKK